MDDEGVKVGCEMRQEFMRDYYLIFYIISEFLLSFVYVIQFYLVVFYYVFCILYFDVFININNYMGFKEINNVFKVC